MSEEMKNSVYEYGELEQRTERRPATVTPYEREICEHMEALFPNRTTRVYREIDSEFLHVDVFVMKAPTKKDFHVIYTTGMSALPMKLPQEFLPQYKDLERAELLLFLPAFTCFIKHTLQYSLFLPGCSLFDLSLQTADPFRLTESI